MKKTHRNKIQRLMLAATLSAGLGLGFSAPLFAGQTHTYIIDLNSKTVADLGTLGGISAIGKGINQTGQVTGISTTVTNEEHVFITGSNGAGMIDVGEIAVLPLASTLPAKWRGTPTRPQASIMRLLPAPTAWA